MTQGLRLQESKPDNRTRKALPNLLSTVCIVLGSGNDLAQHKNKCLGLMEEVQM